MKPLTQVTHVLSKDVRQLRWPLAAYVALVGLATMRAVIWPSVSIGVFDSMMMFVVMLGMIVVALLVQTDSPVRADAYWASRPLAPWAVLAAKITGALLLVLGLALVGQYLGLRAYDLSPRAISGQLVESTRTYGLGLLVAMVLAALTQDFRSFVVALVTVPIVLLLLGSTVLPAADLGRHEPPAWSISVASIIGGAALLAFVYRTRYSRALIWLPGFVVTSSGMVAMLSSSPKPPRPTLGSTRRAQEMPIAVQVDHGQRLLDARGLQLSVSVTPPGDAGEIALVGPSVTLHLRNGSTVSASANTPALDLYAPKPALDQADSWIGASPPMPTSRSFTIPLDEAQRDAAAVGISSIDLDGTITVHESRVVGSLPLRVGARLTRDGTRAAIESWSHSPDALALAVRLSTVSADWPLSGNWLFGWSPAGRGFALVNPTRREAFGLFAVGSTGGGGGPLVLPGSNMMNSTVSLTPSRLGPGQSVVPDDDWLRGAQLTIVRWVPVESYPVHVSTRVE